MGGRGASSGRNKPKVSATGRNVFKKGFNSKTLDEHWGGSHDHSAEYPYFTKEQYAAHALELVQSAADGKKILGYQANGKTVVRYDVKNNDFVKGSPETGIATMFKPESGSAYFHRRKRIEGGKTK